MGDPKIFGPHLDPHKEDPQVVEAAICYSHPHRLLLPAPLDAEGTEAEPHFEDVARSLQLAVYKDVHGMLAIVGLPRSLCFKCQM